MRSDTEYLRLAVEIATESRARGNHPFGALLVGRRATYSFRRATPTRGIVALATQRQTWLARPGSNTIRPFSSDARW
jgi:hypothetical protein